MEDTTVPLAFFLVLSRSKVCPRWVCRLPLLCAWTACAGKLFWPPKAPAELTAEGKAQSSCTMCWGVGTHHISWGWVHGFVNSPETPGKKRAVKKGAAVQVLGVKASPREEEISDAQSVLEHLGSSVLQTAAQQPLSYRVSKGKQRSNLCWSTDLQNLRARGGCAYKHWKIFNFFLHFALLCWGFFPPFCVHVCIFSQGMHAADCTGWGFVWQCESWLFHLWFQLLNYVVIIWITKYFKAKYFK